MGPMKLFAQEKISNIVLFKKPAFDGKELRREYQDLLRKHGATRIEPLPLVNGVVCNFSLGIQLQALREEEEVAVLEENLQVKLHPFEVQSKNIFLEQESYQIIPWGIHRIGADQLWSQATGEGMKVAVLDTGIDLHHPDLQENIAGGVNFVEPHLPPQDDNGHGSHVSGTIAAVKNNYGVVGAAPGAKLYAVKVLNHKGEGYFADVIRALGWCLEQGIQVVNLSFGSNTPSKALHEAIRQVTDKGMIVVAAAGNDGTTRSVDYPAAYPEVVAVGAVDEQNRLASFSSQGPEINLVAPGTRILSTGNGGLFWRLSGTSMATAHVSGIVALIWSMAPQLNSGQILRTLYSSAERLSDLTREQQGAGMVRADLAGKKLSRGKEEEELETPAMETTGADQVHEPGHRFPPLHFGPLFREPVREQ
ncbi:peptidase S8 [Desulfofundulus salinus]|uniref:Peptidase S8 n=2 Tax=Desulfofundulus salinus TaxID=2419843 RepID=A0A494X1W3_9FIRM|nr:peptidase S8 [Desulfofundulus salinum]